MNVDTARNIDYYTGVPLCFLGTIIKRALSLFSLGKTAGRPRRILFIELSEMGSAILADPAMQKLKRTLKADLYFAVFNKNSPSLELLNTVPRENIFFMRDSSVCAVIVDAFRFFRWTRKNRIDTAIDLELFSRFTALLTGFSGAERTVGFYAFHSEGLYRGNFLTHKVAYNPHHHIAKNFLALANALLSDNGEVPYSKTVISDDEITLRKVAARDAEKQAMLKRLGSVCPSFHPGSSRIVLFNTDASDLIPFRRWPQTYYIDLARMVLEQYPRVLILLTGDASERTGKETIVRAVSSERCVNFAGQTTIADLITLYAVSEFMVTNDSGPAQFASVTTMPVFVLFGPETPKLYGPLGTMTPIYASLACSPCVTAANHRKTVCMDNVCLQVLTPAKVLEILRPNLERLR